MGDSLSYFNELAGGPRQGHKRLLGSNLDWGQDLLYLAEWCDAHPTACPIKLEVDSTTACEIVFRNKCNVNGPDHEADHRNGMPSPGWLAISLNKLFDETGSNRYLRDRRPVATAGYSIYVYHITLGDANRMRRDLGLPALPLDCQ